MSRWIIKALLQKALSRVRGGNEINYLLQRYVTRNLPIGNAVYVNKLKLAQHHLAVAARYGARVFDAVRFYEFGAGYDLSMPIIFAAAGVRSQDVVDIRKLARPELCFDMGRRIVSTPFFEETFHRSPNSLFTDLFGQEKGGAMADLTAIGISYHAPCDARRTPFPDGAFDFISSTSVLEHVPAADIHVILRECHRLLATGGVISFIIDLVDHFSYFDHSIPFYNYLRHSARRWELVYNSSMQYQNRLRPDDYLGLCRDAGFRIQEWSITKAGPDEMECWRKRDTKGAFNVFDENTLTPKYIYAVLQKWYPEKEPIMERAVDDMPTVSVIIITYNRKDDLKECLESFLKQDVRPTELIVVDNCSTDGTEELFGRTDAYPEYVRYYRLPVNMGPPGSRNVGLNMAHGDIIVFADDDTLIEPADALARIADRFKKEPQVGILGFKIVNYFTREVSRNEFPHVDKTLDPDREFETSYFVSAICAVRREVFDRCGQFSEDLFHGFEELDLSFRVMDGGYRILYYPGVIVWHKKAASGRMSDKQKWIYLYRNRLALCYKYLGLVHLLVSAVLWYVHVIKETHSLTLPMRGILSFLSYRKSLRRMPVSAGTILRIKALKGRIWY